MGFFQLNLLIYKINVLNKLSRNLVLINNYNTFPTTQTRDLLIFKKGLLLRLKTRQGFRKVISGKEVVKNFSIKLLTEALNF